MHDCDPASPRSLKFLEFMVSAQTPCSAQSVHARRNGRWSGSTRTLGRPSSLLSSSSELGFPILLHVRCKFRRVSYPSDLTAHMQQSDQACRRVRYGPSRRSALHVLHRVLPPADRGPRGLAPSRALAVIEVRISFMHVWWVGGYVGG